MSDITVVYNGGSRRFKNATDYYKDDSDLIVEHNGETTRCPDGKVVMVR